MDMRLGGKRSNFPKILAMGLGLASMVAQAEGKFCVVTNSGQNCFYYDANQCRAAAYQQGGMCVVNQDQLATPRSPISSTMDNVLRAGEEGQRQRMEQREFEARMALLKAQTEAVQQTTAQQQQATTDKQMAELRAGQPPETPLYRCTNGEGSVSYTSTPVSGCVYLGNGR